MNEQPAWQSRQGGESAKIVPMDPEARRELWPVERINGIKMRLGNMTLEELTAIEATCLSREEDARTDRMIIRDYIDTRFTSGPEEA